jgi:galactokinase
MYCAFAPGRVEILGNHTDYNGGVVLSAALELGITCRGRPREDGNIRLRSEGMGEDHVFSAADELLPNATWVDYPVGVLAMLRRRGFDVGAFECEFSSTLPTGAGLSSSAAMEVATAVFLMHLGGFSLSAMDVAKLCRKAENEFVGVNCGLLDQVSSVFGLRNHLVHLDCREESVNRIEMPDGIELLIVNSGVKHVLTGGEYNERREQCFAAAEGLGVEQLRDATSQQVEASDLPDLVKRRALHITGENERVFAGLRALELQDIEAFGRLLFESHESSRIHFENSTPELDLLVALAHGTPGVLGSRLTGGGFGGATVSLVQEEHAEEAAASISRRYKEKTGIEPEAIICPIGDGALEV